MLNVMSACVVCKCAELVISTDIAIKLTTIYYIVSSYDQLVLTLDKINIHWLFYQNLWHEFAFSREIRQMVLLHQKYYQGGSLTFGGPPPYKGSHAHTLWRKNIFCESDGADNGCRWFAIHINCRNPLFSSPSAITALVWMRVQP